MLKFCVHAPQGTSCVSIKAMCCVTTGGQFVGRLQAVINWPGVRCQIWGEYDNYLIRVRVRVRIRVR